MRIVVIHKAGGHDRLTLETRPDPSPSAGEVVVATEAVGVNYADCIVRMGLYASAREYVGWPITPGFEFAGKVAAVGAGVTRVREGDDVLGVTRFDGYASHVVVPEHQVFARPRALDVNAAAGFPAVFLTAHFALFELAHPHRGDAILVHSAAGGVGSALLQLGRRAGCKMVGVVGAAHKVEVARALGADEVIDKSEGRLWERAKQIAPSGYAVICDANGPSTLKDSYRHLGSPGKLVIYGFASMLPKKGGKPNWGKLAADWVRVPRFNPLDLTNDNKSVMAFNLSYLFERRDLLLGAMTELLGWVDEGNLVMPPVTTFPLDAVADAHRAIESGQTVGKLVLRP